ncbi:hypothetical protein Tco_1409013 [Tanacetum coccineum]
MVKIHTDYNVADLLTKAFDVTRFQFLIASIGLELQGYLINDGYADLVRMLGKRQLSDENAEFHQIAYFLSTCSINYALTVSPTIYASYIEPFWNTATSKTINSVKQIYAIVDGKVVVISESSVRSDLLFNDEDGLKDLPEPFNDTYVTPCHTKKVFSNMERSSVNFSGNLTPLFTSMLVQNQAPEGEAQDGDNIFKTQSTTMLNVDIPQGIDTANVHLFSEGHKSGSGFEERDRMKNFELMDNGRRSDKIRPVFTNKDFEELDDHMENVKEETVNAATTGVSTAAVTISTAEPRTPPSSTTVFDDEDVTMAMAQTLIKMKEQKAKEKGVAITDVEDSSRTIRPVRSITTLQPLPTIDPKKGKGVLVEEEPMKIKMRDQGDLQIQADAELAQRLYEE